MYKLDSKKNVSIGDVMTFSELCDLFNRKPTTNRSTQMKAINVWLDIEKVDRTHYRITDIRPPKVVTEKRPKGRPRLSEEEKARRTAIKEANRRPVGRPKMTPEEKEEARKKREAQKPVEGKRPVGRPKLTEEEKAEREAAKLEKRKFRTAKFQKRRGRPKKETVKEKSYTYDLNPRSVYVIPARNVILKLLMKNKGNISGTRKSIMEQLGMINPQFVKYSNKDYIHDPMVVNTPSIANIYYYAESFLSAILSQSIIESLSCGHQLFAVDNAYFYTRNGDILTKANQMETSLINEYVKSILKKYNIMNEANLFYMSKKPNIKMARQEFNEYIDKNFGWKYNIRGISITINEEVAVDLSEEILKQNIDINRLELNQRCIERIRKCLYQHGSKFIGYDPNTVIKFGTDSTSTKQEYEVHCKNVDVFIDKYIRLDPV